ncbi:MAG: hypothetical protein IRY85_11470 [Micromonosporaceae bacterium]|nr:hypothetical protein [Micromonosporaceae bacterium]
MSEGAGFACDPEGADIVCRPDYKDTRLFGVLLTRCPSQDVLITILTNFYDTDPSNNQTYASASGVCEVTGGLGGAGGGSGGGGASGGSGAGAGGGSGAPAGGASDGPSPAPSSSGSPASSGGAPTSPTRSGPTTPLVGFAPLEGGPGGLWVALGVLTALLLGGGAAWWFWRRRTASPIPAPTTETSD